MKWRQTSNFVDFKNKRNLIFFQINFIKKLKFVLFMGTCMNVYFINFGHVYIKYIFVWNAQAKFIFYRVFLPIISDQFYIRFCANIKKNWSTELQKKETKNCSFNLFIFISFFFNFCFLIWLFFIGSPVWKPRDPISLGDAQSTTRKDESK